MAFLHIILQEKTVYFSGPELSPETYLGCQKSWYNENNSKRVTCTPSDHNLLSWVHRGEGLGDSQRNSSVRMRTCKPLCSYFFSNIFSFLASSYASLSLTVVSAEDSWWVRTQEPKGPSTWLSEWNFREVSRTPIETDLEVHQGRWATDCLTQMSVPSSSLAQRKNQSEPPYHKGLWKLLIVKNGENGRLTSTMTTGQVGWGRVWRAQCLLLQGLWHMGIHDRLLRPHQPGIPCSHSSRTTLRHQGLEPLSEAHLAPILTLQPRGSLSNQGKPVLFLLLLLNILPISKNTLSSLRI